MVHYSLQPVSPFSTYITHSTISSSGSCFHWNIKAWKYLTLFLWFCVCVRVSRSALGDKLRAGCLSWEGGRVTVVTDMPKPDLLCLVQLLDGTIQTFNVNVLNTEKHTNTHPSLSLTEEIMCCFCLCLCCADDCSVSAWYSDRLFFPFPIDPILSHHCDLGLKDFFTFCSIQRFSCSRAFLHHQHVKSLTALDVHTHDRMHKHKQKGSHNMAV